MKAKLLKLTIPDGLDFAALRLCRDPDGMISFDWDPIEAICSASGLGVDLFRRSHEDTVAGLIVSWYAVHRANGGASDPVAEDLITEVRIEDDRGGGISHPPGIA